VEDTGITVMQRDRFAGVERRGDERRLVPRLALIADRLTNSWVFSGGSSSSVEGAD